MPIMRSTDRAEHWIPENRQCRIPKRHVAFDTESQSKLSGQTELQTWKLGAGIRWRYGLRTGMQEESCVFDTPEALWKWVSDYTRRGERTVVWAHNLAHDVRISSALEILPRHGFKLEWCNLDSSVSSMTWRSDHGTIVFADTWTWLPVPLQGIGVDIGIPKFPMPRDDADRNEWDRYCMRDAHIVYRCVVQLLDFVHMENLGNWQPTGAGMAYAAWRHRFMSHKILVHADERALAAERKAMHTGRAEAWQHGRLARGIWTELDMRKAYVTIASECDVPIKLKYRTGAISNAQYRDLCTRYAYLAKCHVTTSVPCVPYHTGTKTLWPVGEFTSWLWDTEVNLLLEAGQQVRILDGYAYTRAPALQQWAQWVLSMIDKDRDDVPPVVKTWLNHCGRALIGRISLRAPTWEYHGENPGDYTGITRVTDCATGLTSRLMHVGDRTLIETARTEGRDSLPQITGWIMAECRARLWRAVSAVEPSGLAHVDTDSLLLSRAALAALQRREGPEFGRRWAVKGSWSRVIVYGPRNYRVGKLRKTAGVPRKADEILPNIFTGERWAGISADMEAGKHNAVTVTQSRWEMTRTDPRRRGSAGASNATEPYEVYEPLTSVSSSAPISGVGL